MTVPDRRRTHAATIARQALAVALALGWSAVLVVALLGREREVDADRLREDLRSGDVASVIVVGERRSYGVSEVRVSWQRGLFSRRTTLTQVRGDAMPSAESDPRTVRGSVAEALRRLDPDVQVGSMRRAPTEDRWMGWRVPDPWEPVLLAMALATFGLLVAGPDPEVATRWAWFWLFSFQAVGLLAFVLLGGLWRRHPTPGPQRLTGGTAFVASVLVGLLISVVA